MVVLEENIFLCTVTKFNILMQLLQFYEVNNLQYFIHVSDFYPTFFFKISTCYSFFFPHTTTLTSVRLKKLFHWCKTQPLALIWSIELTLPCLAERKDCKYSIASATTQLSFLEKEKGVVEASESCAITVKCCSVSKG